MLWPADELDRWRSTPIDPWDPAKAAHLLRRAGFGAAPTDVARVTEIGMEAAVDDLLTTGPEAEREWGTLVLPHGEALEVNRELADQRAAWLFFLLHTDQPLREKMVLFWHDHFSVGARQGHNRFHLQAHLNLLRRHALGKVRDLLRALLLDPAMLVWLDNYCNGRPSDGVPRINLNFARELLELYTMGVQGGYTQHDVMEAARCLSGWSMLGPITSNVTGYRDDWHVPGQKTVLGARIDHADGRRDAHELIDVLLRQPATAPFLVGKIWRWLVAQELPAALHAELAKFFVASDYDVHALLSCLLRARVFYAQGTRGSLVRNPVEFAAATWLALGRPPLRNARALAEAVTAMGFPLLDYLTPGGVEDGSAWLSTQRVVERVRFARALTQEPNPFECTADWQQIDAELPRDPDQRARAIEVRCLGDLGDAAVRAMCATALRAAPDPQAGLRAALTQIFVSPHFQCC